MADARSARGPRREADGDGSRRRGGRSPGEEGSRRRGEPGRAAEPGGDAGWRPLPVLLLVLGAVAAALAASSLYGGWSRAEIPYSTFLEQLEQGRVARVHVQGETIRGRFREPVPARELLEEGEERQLPQAPSEYDAFETVAPPWAKDSLGEELAGRDVKISAEPADGSIWLQALIGFLPILLLVGLFWYGSRALQQRAQEFGGQGGPFGMGKSKARRYRRSESDIHFSDVAGADNAKRDLQEIIEYLREPGRYTALGAKLPRGVLLLGPPGTGKTLLARAVAGEADVPFYSISGSEFIETFVGVGAARVRSLFEDAKKEAPAVIFIDEIDSVGRSRGTGVGGGHDEREQTLNQILSEMDGFEAHLPVVVLAATNRPDVLDPALLRPGRFDRKVTLDLPQRVARRRILEVHTRRVPLGEDVDLDAVATATVGFSGADIENLVNEAALLAGRSGRKRIATEDFESARDKIALGHEREEALGEEERRRVAVHEGGHAILAERLPNADPLRKVTIVPRGHALGATEQVPQEERMNRRRSELMDRLAVMLGGRAAEQIVYGEVSSGAAQDLKQATALARRMVSEFGMGERLGAASFSYGEQHVFLGKELSHPRDFSEHTAELIDEEIRALIGEAEARAVETLRKLRAGLDALTEALLERETVEQEEIAALLERSG